MQHGVDSQLKLNEQQPIMSEVVDDSFERCFSDRIIVGVVRPHDGIELLRWNV